MLQQYEREMKRMAMQIEELKKGTPAGAGAGASELGGNKGGSATSDVSQQVPPPIRRLPPERATGTQEWARPPQRQQTSQWSAPGPYSDYPTVGYAHLPPPQPTPASVVGTSSVAATRPSSSSSRSQPPQPPPPPPPPQQERERQPPPPPPAATLAAAPPPPPPTIPDPIAHYQYSAAGSAAMTQPSASPSSPSSPSGVKPRVRWQHPEHLDLEKASAAASAPRWPGGSSAPVSASQSGSPAAAPTPTKRWPGSRPKGTSTTQSTAMAVLSVATSIKLPAGMSRSKIPAPSTGGGGDAASDLGVTSVASPTAKERWGKLANSPLTTRKKNSVSNIAMRALSGMARTRR